MPFYTVIEAVCDRCQSTVAIARKRGIHPMDAFLAKQAITGLEWQMKRTKLLCPNCKQENGKMKKDAKHFIEVWQTAISIEEAANELDWSLTATAARAEHYRRLGIPLKRLNRAESLDVKSLAEYAASLT